MGGVHKTCENSAGEGLILCSKNGNSKEGGTFHEILSVVWVWIFSGTTPGLEINKILKSHLSTKW